MRLAFKTAIACALATPLLAFAAGTDKGGNAPKKPQLAPDYCTFSDVIGAKVSMLPGQKAVNEAKKENELAGRPIGKVTELLVDCCTGSTQWAVVAFDKTLGFGGKSVAVPCDQLRWNTTNECFDLEQSEDQLKALPAFDCADAKKNGLDLSVATLTKHWPNTEVSVAADRSTQKRPSITIDGKHFDCAKPQLILATEITKTPVYANSEKFGAATGGLLDRANRNVAFLIVSHGGTLGVGAAEYLIPFYAMCMHNGEEGKDQVYSVLRSVKELEAGVRYEKPKNGAADPEAIKRACEMFAAEAPKPTGSQ